MIYFYNNSIRFIWQIVSVQVPVVNILKTSSKLWASIASLGTLKPHFLALSRLPNCVLKEGYSKKKYKDTLMAF
jgi:hypothetical protein